jgi:hypothetical protein
MTDGGKNLGVKVTMNRLVTGKIIVLCFWIGVRKLKGCELYGSKKLSYLICP